MRIIEDFKKHDKKIRYSIKKFGHYAEHNFFHYMYWQTSGDKNLFFDYGKGRGMLIQYNQKSNIWKLFPSGVLAPENERLELLLHATKHILHKRKGKKFILDVSEPLRKQIVQELSPGNGIAVSTYSKVFYCPTYNMKGWDPELSGGEMKKLRNIRNRFYKTFNVKVKDCKEVPKEDLRNIVFNWIKNRSGNDRVDEEYYLNLIENNFKGFEIAKTICVNGKPTAITGGWKIPNSKNYYSAVGIIDYSYQGLGELANVDDLNRLKDEGYEHVDFGGSEKNLLKFKKKFKPEKIYKTYQFSILRRDA